MLDTFLPRWVSYGSIILLSFFVNSLFCQSGKALVLNGCDNCLVANGSGAILQNLNNITVEAWIMPNCDDDNRIIIGKEWCQGEFGFYLSLNAGKVTWNSSSNGFCSTVNIYSTNNVVAPAGIFTHVAVVHSSNAVNIYVNGARVSGSWISGSFNSIHSSSEPVRIGCYKNIGGSISNYFSGLLDDVRVWTRALSQSEIQSNMNSSLSGNEAGLVLNYEMESNQIGSSLTIPNNASSFSGQSLSSFIFNSHSPYCIPFTEYLLIKPDLGNDLILCDEFGITLVHGIKDYKMIRWQNGSTNNSLFVDKAGQYSVEIETELCRFIRDTINITTSNVDTTTIETTLCPDEIFTLNGITYQTQGTFYQIFSNQYNCDSIIEINLQYFDVSSGQVNFSLCDGPSIEHNGITYDTPGIYTQTSTDMNGCEVTETITVTACNSSCTTNDTTLCYLKEPYPPGEFGISRVWQSLTSTAVYQSPLIADMDNDCIPDIVTSSVSGFVNSPRVTSGISIINSTTGTLKQAIPTAYFAWGGPTSFAIADIDRDGIPEIILAAANVSLNPTTQRGRLICYDASGNIRWISNQRYGVNTFGDEYGGTPGFADFNQDGIAEVYIYNEIFNAETGVKLVDGGSNGIGTVSSIFNNYAYGTSIAAQLDDNTSNLELAAGYTLYQVRINNISGTAGNSMTAHNILVNNQMMDGFTSIADINLDGKLDVVVTSSGSATTSRLYTYTWQSGGTELIASTALPTSNAGCCPNQVGPAFVGDLSGSGKPSIGVTRPYNLLAYEYDGTSTLKQKWRLSTNDESGATGMTMFDFNQDGKQEIVYRDETNLRILDGSQNPPVDRATIACNSGTGLEYPIVGDIDFTGESKLCVTCGQNSTSTGRIHVFASPDGFPNWAPSRGIWNQYNYHVFNISDNLTIPRVQQSNAEVSNGRFNNFLVQASLLDSAGSFLQSVPNLYGFLQCIQYDEWKGEYTVNFAVGNANNASASFSGLLQISFFHGNPKTSNRKIGSFSFNTLLRPGDLVSNIGYSFDGPYLDSIYMLIHADNQGNNASDFLSPECDYMDNLVFTTDILRITTTQATLCLGDSLLFESAYYADAGEYMASSPGVDGCDTLRRLLLTVQSPSWNTTKHDICIGESIQIGNQSFQTDTVVTEYLTTTIGCDSLVEHTVRVFTPDQLYEDISSCQGDSILFINQWYFEDELVSDTLPTLPCPTYRETQLRFNPTYAFTENTTACPGDTIKIHGLNIMAPGNYQQIFTSYFGCDSTYLINVVYLPDPEKPEFEPDCQSNTYAATLSDSSNYTILWSDGSGGLTTTFEDDQTISIVYTDEEYGCELRAEYELPKIPETAPDVLFQDTTIYPGKPLHYSLDLSQEAWDILWSPSFLFACDTCFENSIITRENADIFIFLAHISGCTYDFDFSIETDPEQDIIIPNIFAPDAPGINKAWTWFIPECFMVQEVKVYDRWGNLVFELYKPDTVTWDGTFKGKAVVDGVYAYVCTYMLPDGSMGKKYGDVTVVHTR